MKKILFILLLLVPFIGKAQTSVTNGVLLDMDNIIVNVTRDSADVFSMQFNTRLVEGSVQPLHQWNVVSFITHDSLCNIYIVDQFTDIGTGVPTDPYALINDWRSYNSAVKHIYHASNGASYTDATINTAIKNSLKIGSLPSTCP